jgi:hypothetical protein
MKNERKIKWNFSHYNDSKGRTYIISYYNEWNSEKKQSRVVKRVHVGRLIEETGEVKCGQKYLQDHPELVGKTLYYENNQLIERTTQELDDIAKTTTNLFYRCDAISFGLTYACWHIANNANMLSHLYKVFGNNGYELLRLAIYQLCSCSSAMYNYEDWICMNYLPDAEPLSSQNISNILASVTQEQIDEYFNLRHNRLVEKHNIIIDNANKQGIAIPPIIMAVDSTSISTYSETITDAAYGHAKQDDFLKQINLTFCVDYETGDTCYAYECEGAITDMSLYRYFGSIKIYKNIFFTKLSLHH